MDKVKYSQLVNKLEDKKGLSKDDVAILHSAARIVRNKTAASLNKKKANRKRNKANRKNR